jgi:GT2 family glycosyltransferase
LLYARVDSRRVSVVVPSWNTRDTTLACIARVRRHTPAPAEVVVIDNGSHDGSADAVAALAAEPGPVPVRLIRNDTNRGYAAATNQGIRATSGRWVVLLNSDVLVTPGWIDGLVSAARNPRVGLVGPMTNNAGSADQALVVPPPYGDESGLDAFAARWADVHRGDRQRVERLIGFCVLVRRATLARIGLLDERFGLGNYEDDDICRRARNAGLTLVVARDVFVHHYGSLSFRANGVDHAGLMRENAVRFAAKWQSRATRPARRPRVSLCMIVRDEATTLARCLAAAAPAVDEIVVADTGSVDDTKAVAASHGARILDVPWTDDFAAARNAALAAATGDWVLSLDADEALAPEAASGLPAVLSAAGVRGIRLPVHNVGASGRVAYVHLALRLFARDAAARFVGRVHEQVQVASVGDANLPVLHYGYADAVLVRQKLARNLGLLEREAAASPEDATLHYYLADTHVQLGDAARAIAAAEHALRLAGTTAADVRALALDALARAHVARHDDAAAEHACRAALTVQPLYIDARLMLARLCRRTGRHREAIMELGRFLADRERLAVDPTAASVPRLRSLTAEPMARAELALVYESLGEVPRARRQIGRALGLAPERGSFRQIAARLGRRAAATECTA